MILRINVIAFTLSRADVFQLQRVSSDVTNTADPRAGDIRARRRDRHQRARDGGEDGRKHEAANHRR